MKKEKVILLIRDGWGYRKSQKDNAIASASTPCTDKLMAEYPNTLLKASGEAVGLPKGYQGNSEVGHMTIGSGRIILQSMKRINESIDDKSFFSIPEFLKAIDNCKKNKSALHIAGLLQEEGVHSHIDHLYALLDLCRQNKFYDVKLHLFTDGRDAPVDASIGHFKDLQKKLKRLGFGEIATISGRYYSMDRDKRWDRTKKAYDCIVEGKSKNFYDPITAIKESHTKGVTDEFILPIKKYSFKGMNKNDSFIFFNFRTDRTRQLTKAIVENDFNEWVRKKKNVYFVAMTQYYKGMNAKIAFKEQTLGNLCGKIISKNNLKQLRISETEKYAHVTFFFNGQTERKYRGESRILVSSPMVPTYDQKPEMSGNEVATKLIKEIRKDKFDFVVANLVNADMVGHSGNKEAIKKAIETVDDCTGRIVDEGLKKGYTILVFADHGNAEDQRPEWRTSHTTNPVPLILVSGNKRLKKAILRKGMGLKDIAPTALEIFGLDKPQEMTGESIIQKNKKQ